jgi:predicted metal-binding membrane protein
MELNAGFARIIRRECAIVGASLIVLTALAWVYLTLSPGMQSMSGMHGISGTQSMNGIEAVRMLDWSSRTGPFASMSMSRV